VEKPNNGTMDKVNFSGGNAQKVLLGLKGLVKLIYHPELDEEPEYEETREYNHYLMETWLGLSDNLVEMWKIIEQKEDYTEETIKCLHESAIPSWKCGQNSLVIRMSLTIFILQELDI
jgi:hypothetical protein